MTRILADQVCLTETLSNTLNRNKMIHDRGRVFTDLAVMIADGGTSISDIEVLGTATGNESSAPSHRQAPRGPPSRKSTRVAELDHCFERAIHETVGETLTPPVEHRYQIRIHEPTDSGVARSHRQDWRPTTRVDV